MTGHWIADVVLVLGAIWLIAEIAAVALICWLFPKATVKRIGVWAKVGEE